MTIVLLQRRSSTPPRPPGLALLTRRLSELFLSATTPNTENRRRFFLMGAKTTVAAFSRCPIRKPISKAAPAGIRRSVRITHNLAFIARILMPGHFDQVSTQRKVLRRFALSWRRRLSRARQIASNRGNRAIPREDPGGCSMPLLCINFVRL